MYLILSIVISSLFHSLAVSLQSAFFIDNVLLSGASVTASTLFTFA
ncbi:MAG: hypothetical protein PHS49_00370 [Candidatus Gracilibacteria bacterium]|nr:hypothetical protein [Candidatus Gracilibacteria bacterium]